MEMWSGKTVSDYNMLKVFGYPAYYHVSDEKLEPQARKAIFLKFKRGVKGYKLWDFGNQKIILSRDVTFDEFFMVKILSSQQVESNETKGILQQQREIHFHYRQIILYRLECHLLRHSMSIMYKKRKV